MSAKTILVVDDSATMRRMVIAALQRVAGATFRQAQSGLEAIEQISLTKPHLVLLDLNMPDIHGLEVLHFLRAHDAFAAIPVIVLTTRGDDESRTAALAAGATHYMTKPFEPADLASHATSLLEHG